MASCPPPGGALPRMSRECVTFDESLARGASSSGALPMGRYRANWELGFSHSRLDHGRQVLRSGDFSASSSSSAFPLGCCPLCLSVSGQVADLWDSPPIPIPVLPGIRQELSWRTHPLHPCGMTPTHACLLKAIVEVVATLPPLTAGTPRVLLPVERANSKPPRTGEIDGG
jgi:hypothetical protein